MDPKFQSDKIVILYHRLPSDILPLSNGSFINSKLSPNGIIPLLVETSKIIKEVVWIGHTTEKKTKCNESQIETNITLRNITLSEEDVNKFYHKSSKEGFWPILHSSVENYHPESIDWEQFVAINRRFAEAAIEESLNENTIIWIHDYNLWLAPKFIRDKLPNARISFFFHTPFPSADIFNILPWRKEIIEHILACDLIGFSIPRYIDNFIHAAKSNIELETIKEKKIRPKKTPSNKTALQQNIYPTKIKLGNKKIKLEAFPVGVNNKKIADLLETPEISLKIAKLRSKIINKKIILSVSRVDYTKGIVELLNAFYKLLSESPKYIGKITLILISVKPNPGIRAYDDYLLKIQCLINEIQEKFSTENWKPIIYSNKNYSFDKLLILYSAIDFLIVPSLRDGMNLVVKEYISANKGKRGNIVLSEFAGASIELHDAIFINPYNPNSVYQGMIMALKETEHTRLNRMRKLYRAILKSDLKNWAEQLSMV